MSDQAMSREHFHGLIGQVRRNGAFPDTPLLSAYDALQARVTELEQERTRLVHANEYWHLRVSQLRVALDVAQAEIARLKEAGC